jgi:hypothetical protein
LKYVDILIVKIDINYLWNEFKKCLSFKKSIIIINNINTIYKTYNIEINTMLTSIIPIDTSISIILFSLDENYLK